jgi:hypothetical protein
MIEKVIRGIPNLNHNAMRIQTNIPKSKGARRNPQTIMFISQIAKMRELLMSRESSIIKMTIMRVSKQGDMKQILTIRDKIRGNISTRRDMKLMICIGTGAERNRDLHIRKTIMRKLRKKCPLKGQREESNRTLEGNQSTQCKGKKEMSLILKERATKDNMKRITMDTNDF